MIPTIDNVSGNDWLTVVLWSVAVWMMARAIFRSFPARELEHWLWSDGLRARMRRLEFEATRGVKWNPALMSGDKRAVPQPMDSAELKSAREELRFAIHDTRARRAISYLLACTMCQNFWTALLAVLLLGQCGVIVAIASAAGYGGLAVGVDRVLGAGPRETQSIASAAMGAPRTGCKGCGDH